MNILREIGGWDVYNVTEDADIGIRLARFGYHCGAITCPTWEEAPTRFSDWLPQRTRWLKGWMQTMLVCTRDIPQLHRQLGVGNHFLLHMVMTSIVVSVLVHPFFLGMTLWHLYHFSVQHSYSFVEIGIMAFSMFNLTLGYLTYGLLAYAVLAKTPAKYLVKWIWFLPVYWVLISVAGWRAFFQVLYNPHHWEKTEHGKAKRNTPEIMT